MNEIDIKTLPKISVIIPTFNRKEMLKEALHSVLNQDYQNIEIIISDNASTDGTEEMIKKYCEKYSNIVYIRRTHNVGAHLNAYLAYKEHGTGEFIYFLSDDDFLMSTTFFSHAINIFDQYPQVKIVSGIITMLTPTSTEYWTLMQTTKQYINGHDYIMNVWSPNMGGKYQTIISQFFLVRKTDIDTIEAFQWCEYGDLVLKYCLPTLGDVYFLPELIGCYRLHKEVTDATDLSKIQNQLPTLCRFIEYLQSFGDTISSYTKEEKDQYFTKKILDDTVIEFLARINLPLREQKKLWIASGTKELYPSIYEIWKQISSNLVHRTFIKAPGIKQSFKLIIKGHIFLIVSIIKKISKMILFEREREL